MNLKVVVIAAAIKKSLSLSFYRFVTLPISKLDSCIENVIGGCQDSHKLVVVLENLRVKTCVNSILWFHSGFTDLLLQPLLLRSELVLFISIIL